ncbi:class II aldolase/adducin family protein [Actinomadura sp. NEAU-AAG7]|uniref:class II aldolase/adducin family protein n=1 Tax=Actinomadura sp. NEAU-AAG7 TaxID=2839640 RepID=UPI001BE4DC30|nr:class II aldolase/adducin family protein [Actinomadura sp. NEAU-AAG7]MBT2211512.1 class II aldolase/adducin family protein [Actinomadura sp. NEAU-AAG7]
MLLEAERAALCGTGRGMVEAGLVLGSSGNASVRAGGLVAVTPGGMRLDRLEPADCPVVDVRGRRVDGRLEPSSETPLHLALYGASPASAVVHTHSTHGVAVASTLTELPPVHYNTLLLGGVVQVAPYATYGTAELAANVEKAMSGGMRAALLANHGGVAVGGDLDEAFENARLLEWLCEVYVRAKAVGDPRVLSGEELARAAERGHRPRGYGPS